MRSESTRLNCAMCLRQDSHRISSGLLLIVYLWASHSHTAATSLNCCLCDRRSHISLQLTVLRMCPLHYSTLSSLFTFLSSFTCSAPARPAPMFALRRVGRISVTDSRVICKNTCCVFSIFFIRQLGRFICSILCAGNNDIVMPSSPSEMKVVTHNDDETYKCGYWKLVCNW